MAANAQLAKLVDQMPEPDGRGMLTGDMDKEKIEKVVAQIAAGGREHVLGLIAMLGEPGSEENAKPHYALHCVVNHTLIAGDQQRRRETCEAVASQLSNQELHPYNRSYLCQQLHWAGADECCAALGSVLLDGDVTDDAATALVAIGGKAAASQLRKAWPQATGKARLNLIDALAAMADAESAGLFQHALQEADREVRIAAAVGLANLGIADSAKPLLQAADAAGGWERTQITKACLVLAEKLAAAGNNGEAKRIYRYLHESRSEEKEQHVRHAAQLGLATIE